MSTQRRYGPMSTDRSGSVEQSFGIGVDRANTASIDGSAAAEWTPRRRVRVALFGIRCSPGPGADFALSGPNWIHGTSDNPILDLAHKTSTRLHIWGERQQTFDTDGSAVPAADVAEASAAFWSIVSDAFKYSNKHTRTIDPSESLLDFIGLKATERYSGGDLPESERARKEKLLLEESQMWGAFVAGSTKRQSFKFVWLEECIEGENPFVADTYKKILDEIARPVLAKAGVVRFETEVTRIANEGKDGGVIISTDQEEDDTFDEVIVTSPLGWLKHNQALFQPALPPRLSNAINNIGYGQLDKIYIAFPTAFWDSPESTTGAPITATRSSDVPNTTATTAPLHNAESTDEDQRHGPSEEDHYPGFTHWYSPTYSKATNPHGYNQQSINMAALPPSCAQPTLLFYVSGECAIFLSKLQSSAKSDEARKESLLRFFEPYLALLPTYSRSNPACKPVDLLATNWAADRLSGYGSYSNFQVGLEAGNEDIETMRHGSPERHIWLAGEHTAPFIALGTVTGAWWSGERVVERLLDTYGVVQHK